MPTTEIIPNSSFTLVKWKFFAVANAEKLKVCAVCIVYLYEVKLWPTLPFWFFDSNKRGDKLDRHVTYVVFLSQDGPITFGTLSSQKLQPNPCCTLWNVVEWRQKDLDLFMSSFCPVKIPCVSRHIGACRISFMPKVHLTLLFFHKWENAECRCR